MAERLAAQRPPEAPPLNVCLEVNIAGEPGKGGVMPAELPDLAAAVARLPRLALRGLMCIPPEETEPARQRAWFARLRDLRDDLNAAGCWLSSTLSMGMSADFEAAIQEGATIVRLGTVLFGARPGCSAALRERSVRRQMPIGGPGESAAGAFSQSTSTIREP